MATTEKSIAAASPGAKVALVTGASPGIGGAIARRLVADGFQVFGTSRKRLERGADGVEMIRLDVCSDEAVQSGVGALLERTGRIDVLVNNAGYLLSGAVEETTIEEGKAVLETNFFGAFRVIKAVLPTMRAQKSGRIVNVTSLAGVVPLPFWGFYNASNFALEGLTETLRYELQPFGISVSAIEPGSIKTDLYTADPKARATSDYAPWRDRFSKRMAEFERKAPGPELVADAVAKAIRARNPALRHRVTREATLFTALRRWFPASLFERGVRSGFRLDDERYVAVAGTPAALAARGK
jgi:NAD(P)-dependent dehydrogenase (short-subunit alcohol dehydrogenase family)